MGIATGNVSNVIGPRGFSLRIATRLGVASLLALGAAGCVPSARAVTDDFDVRTTRQAFSTDRVTRDELSVVDGATLEDGLRRTRPELLRPTNVVQRGSVVVVVPAVFLDDRYSGGIEFLRSIPLQLVAEVRYLRPMTARTTFGAHCPCDGGALSVRTRVVR